MGGAKIVSFINYKGGVGKTTTTYHIGCSLAYHYGKKVLLVDIDPQTNLTFLCVDYDSWKRFKLTNGTIASLYEKYKKKRSSDIKRVIWKDPVGQGQFYKVRNLDLLPCDLDLLGEDIMGMPALFSHMSADNPFQHLKMQAKETLRGWLFLKELLSRVENSYDFILIDCPPNIYMMTQNALVASYYYVVTTIPEYLSSIGLNILQRKVKEIGKKVEETAKLAGREDICLAKLGGIIFVKVRIGRSILTKQHSNNMELIRRDFPNHCFEHYTTELIGYSEAAEKRLPIWLANTENAKRAAKKLEYENITIEFLRRFS